LVTKLLDNKEPDVCALCYKPTIDTLECIQKRASFYNPTIIRTLIQKCSNKRKSSTPSEGPDIKKQKLAEPIYTEVTHLPPPRRAGTPIPKGILSANTDLPPTSALVLTTAKQPDETFMNLLTQLPSECKTFKCIHLQHLKHQKMTKSAFIAKAGLKHGTMLNKWAAGKIYSRELRKFLKNNVI
jgi:hypothetical protein